MMPTVSSVSLPDRSSRNAASRSEGLGEPERPDLERRVVCLTDVAHFADDRADVDDPTAASLDHVSENRLRQEERAREVDVQDLVPVVVGQLRIVLSIVMPALLIKMSSRPCSSRTSLTTRRQSSGEATLPRWVLTASGVIGWQSPARTERRARHRR